MKARIVIFLALFGSMLSAQQVIAPFSTLATVTTADTSLDRIVYLHWNGSKFVNVIVSPGTLLKKTAGTITGSGTTNFVTKWTGAHAQGNSLIFDNGTNVGIGTTSPGSKLDLIGSAHMSGSLFVNGLIGIGSPSSATGGVILYNSTNNNTVTIQAGATSASYSFTTPINAGTIGYVLSTNGSGVTSWVTPNTITTTKSITAHAGGGQSSATILTTKYNRIDTCSSDHDSSILISGIINNFYSVNNVTTKIADVYPATGEKFLGLSTNSPLSIAGGSKAIFICYETGVWTIE